MPVDQLAKILGTVAPYAGLGGIAVAATFYLFQSLISRNIFPQLDRERAYQIIMRVVHLSFLLGIVGVGAWVATNLPGQRGNVDASQVSSNAVVPANTSPAPPHADNSPPIKKPSQSENASQDDSPWPGAGQFLGRWKSHESIENDLRWGAAFGKCVQVLHGDLYLVLDSRTKTAIEGTLSTEGILTERYEQPDKPDPNGYGQDYLTELCQQKAKHFKGSAARDVQRKSEVRVIPADADPDRIMMSLTLQKCTMNDQDACTAGEKDLKGPDQIKIDADGRLHWQNDVFERVK